MAKNMQPVAKRCKTLGISPAFMGDKLKVYTISSILKKYSSIVLL